MGEARAVAFLTGGAADEGETDPIIPLPEQYVSLVKVLKEQLDRVYRQKRRLEEDDLCEAIYDNNLYIRHRAPYEMEEVLATLDQKALQHFQKSFGDRCLTMQQFAEAIVKTGTYDADRIHAFVGGIVDLYLEVRRSQGERAQEKKPLEIQWCQLMNHLIESPEIAMYEGSAAMGVQANGRGDPANQPTCERSKITDCASHPGGNVEKIYWNSHMGDLLTVEGTDSMYFWTPEDKIYGHRSAISPQLPSEFYDESGYSLFTVIAAAWDLESQDLTALLSNRMIVVWRLRSREKGQFQQKKEMRIHGTQVASAASLDGTGRKPVWKLHIKMVNWKDTARSQTKEPSNNESLQAGFAHDKKQELKMMGEMREERAAVEEATMLDMWWNANMRMYVTTDRRGRLFFWDLRQLEGSGSVQEYGPSYQLNHHRGRVTGMTEFGKHKFTTISLDHMVMLWDNRNLAAPEIKIEEHSHAVLSQAYLPLYSSLVTVGCEKRVFVWSIDTTAYRGVRAKLEAHRDNLKQVSAGQKCFFTLDEGFMCIVWDGATLANLQAVNCASQLPKHVCVLPLNGVVCLAGRRLNFYEGNEPLNSLLGKTPTKDQLAKRKAEELAAGSLKERAKAKWCGISTCRGSMLSVTEAELKMHARDHGKSRVVFNAPAGESISAFVAIENMSLSIVGTNKGGLHFLKYRSGFELKSHPGRKVEETVARPQARKEGAASGAGGGADENDTRRRQSVGPGSAASAAPSGPPSPGGGQDSPSQSRVSFAAGGSAAGSPSAADSPHRGSTTMLTMVPEASDSGSVTAQGDTSETPAANGRVMTPQDEGRDDIMQTTQQIAEAPLANAPTAEEIARGLTANILCILPCEERGRLFVGTAEGQILVFALDAPDFPCIRWANASPDDCSQVICMEYTTNPKMLEGTPDDDQLGLLVVGTKDGCVQLFGLDNLRHVGAIQIPRILPDFDAPNGVPLSRVMFLESPAAKDLPCTLMTVDSRSRMRLWGMRINKSSGKLRELRLVVDGEQPLPLRLEPFEGVAETVCTLEDMKKPDIVYLKTPEEIEEEEKLEKDEIARAKREGVTLPERKKSPGMPYATRSKDQCTITDFTRVKGRIALPTWERFHWTAEAGKRPPRIPPEDSEEEEEEDAGAAFMTQPSGPGSPFSRASPKDEGGKGDGKGGKKKKKDEDSDTDGEDPERVKPRLEIRPKTPPLLREDEELDGPNPAPWTYGDGTHLVFIADSEGWIRCMDMAASVTACVEDEDGEAIEPRAVRLEDPVQLAQMASKKARNSTVRFGTGSLMGSTSGSFGGAKGAVDPGPLLTGPPVEARREVWKTIGAWRVSKQAVMSITATESPPGLVTIDAAKEVKVWSTCGQLWAHVSLSPQEGFPEVPLWPPPQTLAQQLWYMDIAKAVTDKLGMNTKRKRPKPPPVAPSSPSTRASPSGRQRGGPAGSSPSGRPRPSPEKPAVLTESAQIEEPEAAQWETNAAVVAPGSDAGLRNMDLDDVNLESLDLDPPEAAAGEGDAASPAPADFGERTAKPKRMFSSNQLSEMIRNNAFSGGCQSYKSFRSKKKEKEAKEKRQPEKKPIPRGEPCFKEIQDRRKEFFGRSAEAFGIEIATKADADQWDNSVRGLGNRSSSEGALLRFADQICDAHSVRDKLNIDVTRIPRAQIRRPTFLANLDIGGVSTDPMNPLSATSQAVQELTGKVPGAGRLHRPSSAVNLRAASNGDTGHRQRTPLQSAGMLAVGKR